MSLTKEAIQEISDLSVKSSGVNINNLKNTDNKVAIIPNGTIIKALEKYNKHRDNFRGEFTTKSINSFIEYNKHQQCDNATCFINSNEMLAKTIFDLGTKEAPLHCLHSANLELDKTSDYKSLLRVIGFVDQKKLSDFIEDWNDNITCYAEIKHDDTQEVIANKLAVQAVRKVKIESSTEIESEVGDFEGKQSILEQAVAKAGDYSKKLPSLILFKCAPYNGLKEYVFTVRVSVITSNSQPTFSLRIINHEKQCDEMVEEFMSIITDKLSDTDIKTYIGNFDSKSDDDSDY